MDSNFGTSTLSFWASTSMRAGCCQTRALGNAEQKLLLLSCPNVLAEQRCRNLGFGEQGGGEELRQHRPHRLALHFLVRLPKMSSPLASFLHIAASRVTVSKFVSSTVFNRAARIPRKAKRLRMSVTRTPALSSYPQWIGSTLTQGYRPASATRLPPALPSLGRCTQSA